MAERSHPSRDSTIARSQIGTLYRSVGFVAPMLWGGFADWSGQHARVFMLLACVQGLVVAGLTLQPESFAWQAFLFLLCGLSDGGALLDAIIMR